MKHEIALSEIGRTEIVEDLDDYQTLANGFINRPRYTDSLDMLNNAALGIAGEGGEFADLVKKLKYHGHPHNNEVNKKILKELGDVLWYVAQGCAGLGVTLSYVATMNIRKLHDRHGGEKFSESASIAKDESKEATNL
jgi:NTP pyrophosphatase (non-canonical NTP hydrolase)